MITIRLIALVCLLAVAGRQVDDGVVLADDAYAFPPFAEAPGYVAGDTLGDYWSEAAYRAATEDERFELRKLRYASEGLQVVAYTYAPREPEGRPRPTVIFNRGSYVVGDQAPVLVPLFHHFAERGFAVVAPMLRGSDGGEGRDEMGGADVADLMNVVPLLEELDFVDVDALFLLGESRGGMMTFQAIREGFPARAAATYGAFTDLGTLIETDDSFRQLAHWLWPEFVTDPEHVIGRRSALSFADRLTVPLLLLHGGEDDNIPTAQALQLALALEQAGLPYELHVYAGDGHLLLRNKADALDRIAEWFARHQGE